MTIGIDSFEQEIREERARQDAKWGEQNHPNGTGTVCQTYDALKFKAMCEKAAKEGRVTWRHILAEEFAEAMAEADPEKLRAELIQCAAVIKAWVASIDRCCLRENGARVRRH